jgi:hypothetical protein
MAIDVLPKPPRAPPALSDGRVAPAGDRAALLRAHATLSAGCRFMASDAASSGDAPRPLRGAHARMLGNRFRELDLFLSVMLGEVELVLGCPDQDRRKLRLFNTPNKFRRLRPMLALAQCPEARLRAIGRVGACLRHCEGRVHRPEMGQDILLAHGEDCVPLPPRTVSICRRGRSPPSPDSTVRSATNCSPGPSERAL